MPIASSKFFPLAALFISLQGSTVSAAELKSKDPLKLRVGLGSSPVPPLPNSVSDWPKT
jgi:hypothetical protein